jgi:hypothetical protein
MSKHTKRIVQVRGEERVRTEDAQAKPTRAINHSPIRDQILELQKRAVDRQKKKLRNLVARGEMVLMIFPTKQTARVLSDSLFRLLRDDSVDKLGASVIHAPGPAPDRIDLKKVVQQGMRELGVETPEEYFRSASHTPPGAQSKPRGSP